MKSSKKHTIYTDSYFHHDTFKVIHQYLYEFLALVYNSGLMFSLKISSYFGEILKTLREILG